MDKCSYKESHQELSLSFQWEGYIFKLERPYQNGHSDSGISRTEKKKFCCLCYWSTVCCYGSPISQVIYDYKRIFCRSWGSTVVTCIILFIFQATLVSPSSYLSFSFWFILLSTTFSISALLLARVHVCSFCSWIVFHCVCVCMCVSHIFLIHSPELT